jgi:NAD(P)-dependent dehydrogenase (short-subunit alcohol dehydrogenase family)
MYDQLFSLEGRTIIVTGASSGLGKGLALAYAKAGANIVLADIDIVKLEELRGEIESLGGKAIAVKTDVTQKADIDLLIKSTVEKFGCIDVLLNNAGISIPRLLAEQVTEEQMQKIMDVNLKGSFLCGTAVARYMLERKKGKIINMSSVAGQSPWAGASIYSVSKAAVNHITRAWAIEWAARNVTVNAIAPAFVITDMNRHLFLNKEYNDRVLSHLPMGRLLIVDDLIGPAIFLASDASNIITGQVLAVDGGWTCL